MIDVEIYDCGDLVIRNIGEELIRENHKSINFYFVNEAGLGASGYTILNEKNMNIILNNKLIILTEKKDGDGIFLYQAKANIKAEILKIVGSQEKVAKMEIIGVLSPYNLSVATISSHYIARDLAGEGNRVCFLSFNIDFPFNFIGWNNGSRGLVKALYYYNNKEKLNPGITSHSIIDHYYYINVDIKSDEIFEITNIFVSQLIEFLETQNFRFLVLDYGVLYWELKRIEDHLYYVHTDSHFLIKEMYLKQINSISKISDIDVVDLGSFENIISLKNGQIRFNNDREELVLWKRNLKKRLYKN